MGMRRLRFSDRPLAGPVEALTPENEFDIQVGPHIGPRSPVLLTIVQNQGTLVAMNEQETLFDEQFMRRINRLSLVVHKRRSGQLKGERRSTKRGTSVEFADYRDYVQGDDLRRVDWNIYARLERPFIKLFEEEEDLSVYILIDASASMDWGGEPGVPVDHNKWRYTRRVAGALGYIALGSGDRLTIALLQEPNDDRKPTQFGPTRGRAKTLSMLRFLSQSQAGGITDLNQALRNFALTAQRPGLLVLISDLFSPAGYQEGLGTLLAQGYEGVVLHTLAPDEANPPLVGDLKLVDVETSQTEEVTIDAGMHSLYTQRLQAWQGEINRWCGQHGASYVPVTTDTPFDQFILFHLRQRGLVR